MCRIVSTIGKIRWFLVGRSPVCCEDVKKTRTELRKRETFGQARERVGRPAHNPGTKGSDTVNRMTKSELVVLITLLTLLTCILLFLSR